MANTAISSRSSIGTLPSASAIWGDDEEQNAVSASPQLFGISSVTKSTLPSASAIWGSDTTQSSVYEPAQPITQDLSKEQLENLLLLPGWEPTTDPRFSEYYVNRNEPVPTEYEGFSVKPWEGALEIAETKERDSFLETVRKEGYAADVYSSLDDQGKESLRQVIVEAMREGSDMRGSDPISNLLSYLPASGDTGTKLLLNLADYISAGSARAKDALEETLTGLYESDSAVAKSVYSGINGVMSSFGRMSYADDPRELTNRIADAINTAGEFSETLGATGLSSIVYTALANNDLKIARRMREAGTASPELLDAARRNSPEAARLATMNAAEDAKLEAARVANQNAELRNEILGDYLTNEQIIAFQERTGKTIATQDADGNLKIDYQAARAAADEVLDDISAKGGEAYLTAVLAGEESADLLTKQVLDPDKLNGIVAVAADLKKQFPDLWNEASKLPVTGNKKRTVIDTMLDLSVSGKMSGDAMADLLTKYGLTYDDYMLATMGSASRAGQILQKFSQLGRRNRLTPDERDELKRIKQVESFWFNAFKRTENVRRGLLVSQVGTAMRNLASATMLAPAEALVRMFDDIVYGVETGVGVGQKLKNTGNAIGAFGTNLRNLSKMYSRPDVYKGYSQLILGNPEFKTQADQMFNMINEIRQRHMVEPVTGTQKFVDSIVGGAETVTEFLNTPNRFQEQLIRNGVFMSDLQRLVKREWGIDLIDTLQNGKLAGLINNASDLKPQGARGFEQLVTEAADSALTVTFGKAPESKTFRKLANGITESGFGTLLLPFPRFMFRSIEMMSEYTFWGALTGSKVLSRKIFGKGAPTTARERQLMGRNLVGYGVLGAAYAYRDSDEAPADSKYIEVDGKLVDTTPFFPLRQILYMAEIFKRINDDTMAGWFDQQEALSVFTGTNFKDNSMAIQLIEDATEVIKGVTGEEDFDPAAAERIGKQLGNIAATYLTPLNQVIEMQRGFGYRPDEYKLTDQPLSADGMQSFINGIRQPFRSRGYLTDDEFSLDPKIALYSSDGIRKRPDSFWKGLMGVSAYDKSAEYGDYLYNLGFTEFELQSSNRSPRLRNEENKVILHNLPLLYDNAKLVENDLVRMWEENESNVQSGYSTFSNFIHLNMRSYISEEMKAVKSGARDYVEGELYRPEEDITGETEKDARNRVLVEDYITAMYRRIPSELRQRALADWRRENPDTEIDYKDWTVLENIVWRSQQLK